jgi:hypothetical protein
MLYFSLFVLLFVWAIDSVTNFFIEIPVGVAYLSFVLLFVIGFSVANIKCQSKLLNISLFISLYFFLNLFLKFLFGYPVGVSDVSDVVFLNMFTTFPIWCFYFFDRTYRLKAESYYRTFLCVSLLIFMPSFFGVEAGDAAKESDLFKQADDIEFLRQYKQGLFRIPHIASYFFLFIFLVSINLYLSTRKLFFVIVSLLSFFVVYYIGSRAGFFAIFIYFLAFFFVGRLRLFIMMVFVLLFVVYNVEYILDLTSGTYAFQYASFFYTLMNDYERLSRFIIWESWYVGISSLNFLEFMFGSTFSDSLNHNYLFAGHHIWFHNDFFSVFYCFGFVGLFLLVYSYFLIFGFIKKVYNVSDRTLFSYFSVFIFLAFNNGFYFYFSHLILSLIIVSVVGFCGGANRGMKVVE